MEKVLLIYWPKSGNVEKVGQKFISHFKKDQLNIVSIDNINEDTLKTYDYWIIGGSTVGSHVWEDADDTNKWWSFFKSLDNIDLSGKKIAFYGLGDQVLYPNHFVDGLVTFKEEFEKRNARIYGKWPNQTQSSTSDKTYESAAETELVIKCLTNNPRKEILIEIPLNNLKNGTYVDPWDRPYIIAVDENTDGNVELSADDESPAMNFTGANIIKNQTVAVASWGRDPAQTSKRIYSWD